MTLEELIQAFRLQADDTRVPVLWEDEEITRYLNEAEREASERGFLIYDEVSSEATDISFDVEQSSAPLHESVLFVDRVTIDSSPLPQTTREEMDRTAPQWHALIGPPTRWFVVEGISADVLVMVPKPAQVTTLKLSVYRTALAQMESSSDEPEIHSRYHFRLIDWALFLAYRKEDEETKDLKKAERHEVSFARAFGKGVDENVHRKWRRKRQNVVQMNPGW